MSTTSASASRWRRRSLRWRRCAAVQPSSSAARRATWRSVGKLPASARIIAAAPGASSPAAISSLKRLTEVESATSVAAGRGADQPADLVADRAGAPIQSCVVPAARSASRPIPASTTSARRSAVARGQGAERIAVEIDHALRHAEACAEGAQRIGVIECLRVRESRQRSRHPPLFQLARQRAAVHAEPPRGLGDVEVGLGQRLVDALPFQRLDRGRRARSAAPRRRRPPCRRRLRCRRCWTAWPGSGRRRA